MFEILAGDVVISIHALREEGDGNAHLPSRLSRDISIHALREEGDLSISRKAVYQGIFLSTPSVRRATSGGGVRLQAFPDFYPRPP